MKRLILCLCWLLPVAASAQSFDEGVKAYERGDYPAAIAQWEGVLRAGQTSGELLYNLGNAHYRAGDMARAVLNYERALRLMPRDRETRENLALARSKTQDRIAELPQLFLVRGWHALARWFSPRGWMWVCLLWVTLLSLATAFFFLSRQMRARKASLAMAATLALLLLVSALATASAARAASSRAEAIVMAPVAVVKSSPDAGGLDKLVLHEGTKVRIEERAEGWSKIRIADGNTGWLPVEDMEVI